MRWRSDGRSSRLGMKTMETMNSPAKVVKKRKRGRRGG